MKINRKLFPIAVLVLLTVIVYARSLFGSFLLWDDTVHVFQNPYFQPVTPAHIAFFWEHPYEGLYIPLSYTFFALLVVISHHGAASGARFVDQLYPQVFHGADLLLHAINAVLVYLVIRKLTRRMWPSLIGSALFALHPLQVESVAWISETRGTLAALFCLASIYWYVLFQRLTAVGWTMRARSPYVLSLLALVMALLAKPDVATLPLVLISISMLRFRTPFRSALLTALPFLLAVAPFVIITQHIQKIPLEYPVHVAFAVRPLIAFDALAFYLVKLALPVQLVSDYGWRPDVALRSGLPYFDWLLPVAVGLGAWMARRARPLVALGALTALWFLLPVLGFTAFIYQSISTVADRYCYLALFGVGLAVAGALPGRWDRRVCGTAAAILAIFAAITVVQEGYWENSISLLSHTVSINSHSAISYHDLGIALINAHRPAAAADALTHAESLDSQDFLASYWKGVALVETGRTDLARAEFARAATINPQLSQAYFNMALLDQGAGNTSLAASEYAQALKLRPSLDDARIKLALMLIMHKRYAEAAPLLDAGIAQSPGSAQMHEMQAILDERLHRSADAVTEMGQAAALSPNDGECHLLYGMVLFEAHRAADGGREIGAAQALFGNRETFAREFRNALATLGLKVTHSRGSTGRG